MSETDEATSGSRVWRLLAFAAVVLFIGLLVFGLISKGSSRRIDEALANGTAPLAPSFDLPLLERGELPPQLAVRMRRPLREGQLNLADLRGTPFVLNFWASWCIPCREEAPLLEGGWNRFGARGVLFLGLNMQDLTGDARSFLDEFGITYPTIRDQGNDVARSYGATGIPETYFVTARGRVVGHVVGVVSDRQLGDGAEAAQVGRLTGTLSGGARREQR
jgi:cytochrome c biogenesis protein CcmG, thiol:disulfide interchange protein DsbE